MRRERGELMQMRTKFALHWVAWGVAYVTGWVLGWTWFGPWMVKMLGEG
jgi:hypothetical protein